jgi:hypothetical protein
MMAVGDEEHNILPPQVPDGWSVFHDSTHNRFYYVNTSSGETVWTLPASAVVATSQAQRSGNQLGSKPPPQSNSSTYNDTGKSRLPIGWTAYVDAKTKRWYYVGPAGETTWYRPGSNETPQDQQQTLAQQQQQSTSTQQTAATTPVTHNTLPIIRNSSIQTVGGERTTTNASHKLTPPGPPPAPSTSASPSWKLAPPKSHHQGNSNAHSNISIVSGVPRRRRSSDSRSRSLSTQIEIANKGQRLFRLGYDRRSDQPFELGKLQAK